jgi:hypothetical protein
MVRTSTTARALTTSDDASGRRSPLASTAGDGRACDNSEKHEGCSGSEPGGVESDHCVLSPCIEASMRTGVGT